MKGLEVVSGVASAFDSRFTRATDMKSSESKGGHCQAEKKNKIPQTLDEAKSIV